VQLVHLEDWVDEEEVEAAAAVVVVVVEAAVAETATIAKKDWSWALQDSVAEEEDPNISTPIQKIS
jgi:hypothetical protein